MQKFFPLYSCESYPENSADCRMVAAMINHADCICEADTRDPETNIDQSITIFEMRKIRHAHISPRARRCAQ